MFEKVDIVTFGAAFIQTLMRAAGLFTCNGGCAIHSATFRAMAQFDGVEQVGVEHAGVSVMRTRLKRSCSSASLSSRFLHELRRTVDAAAFFHRQTHFITDFRPVFVTFLITRGLSGVFLDIDDPARPAPQRAHFRRLRWRAAWPVHRPNDQTPPAPPASWSRDG